jgi:hypothetical protein
MVTVDIPITDPKKPPKLSFPDRCVNCGKPKARAWTIKLNTGAQKRGQMVEVELDVPLCADCLAKENRIGNVTWIPFFLVGLLTCAVVFVPVWLISPEGPTIQTAELPYVLGAAAGLLAGIIIGTLVEFGMKLLFAPVYGKLVLQRPLTIFSVLGNSEHLIGIAARLAENRKILKLTFENEEIAREFIAMNPQENS